MSCLPEGFDSLCGHDVTVPARQMEDTAKAAIGDFVKQANCGSSEVAGRDSSPLTTKSEDEETNEAKIGEDLHRKELSLTEEIPEEKSLHSAMHDDSTVLVQHTSDKSGRTTRAQELEELRQRSLASQNAVKIKDADFVFPTDMDTFQKKQRALNTEQRINQKLAREGLHAYRADDKQLLEEIKRVSPDKKPHEKLDLSNPAYSTMADLGNFDKLQKEIADWKKKRDGGLVNVELSEEDTIALVSEKYNVDISVIKAMFGAEYDVLEETKASQISEAPATPSPDPSTSATPSPELPTPTIPAQEESLQTPIIPTQESPTPVSQECCDFQDSNCIDMAARVLLIEQDDIDELCGRSTEKSRTKEQENIMDETETTNVEPEEAILVPINITSTAEDQAEKVTSGDEEEESSDCHVVDDPQVSTSELHDEKTVEVKPLEKTHTRITALASKSRHHKEKAPEKTPRANPVSKEKKGPVVLKKVPLYNRQPSIQKNPTLAVGNEDAALCPGKYIPNLHGSRDACERCLYWASPEEQSRFFERGYHLRIMMVRGGCGRDCSVFPRNSDEYPVRMCKKCYFDTHKLSNQFCSQEELRLLWSNSYEH